MKNFYIQTIVLLFVVLAGFTSQSNAQFASSNEVYCYQYVKTVEDGVTRNTPNYGIKEELLFGYIPATTRSEDYEFYFVVFQGNRIAFRHIEDVTKYRSIVLTEPDYFSFNGVKGQMDYDINTNQIDYRYNQAASTSSKYTYEKYAFRSTWKGWQGSCYSFSLDKSEMIIWYPSRDIRIYYKRINPNSLKPNLDFLD